MEEKQRERLPRHGEDDAYPSLIPQGTMLEVIQQGPAGGYPVQEKKEVKKVEGERIPPGEDGSTQITTLSPIYWLIRHAIRPVWMRIKAWGSRRHPVLRWTARWTTKSLLYLSVLSWAVISNLARWSWIITSEILSPPRRRRAKRQKHRHGGDKRGKREREHEHERGRGRERGMDLLRDRLDSDEEDDLL